MVSHVHHDLRDLRVTDVGLQRSEAQDAVADLANDEELLLRGERPLLLVQELTQALVNQPFELVIGKRRIVQARPEDLDEAFLDLRPDLADPVLLLRLRQPICEGHVGGLLGSV
jgi:hypothetical protein